MHIFLIGFMGSGKSYWGQRLAESMGRRFIDLDSVIEEKQKKSIAAIFEDNGEQHFRELERQELGRLIEKPEPMVIACGGGTPCYFDNMLFMKQNGLVVWLDPTVASLEKRLKPEKDKRPLIRSVPDEQLAVFIEEKLKERIPFYSGAHLHIFDEPFTLEKILQQIKDAN